MMKAQATIRNEIRRLRKMSEDARLPPQTRTEAYEAYHALRWVIEDVDWRPSTIIAKAAADAEGDA